LVNCAEVVFDGLMKWQHDVFLIGNRGEIQAAMLAAGGGESRKSWCDQRVIPVYLPGRGSRISQGDKLPLGQLPLMKLPRQLCINQRGINIGADRPLAFTLIQNKTDIAQ